MNVRHNRAFCSHLRNGRKGRNWYYSDFSRAHFKIVRKRFGLGSCRSELLSSNTFVAYVTLQHTSNVSAVSAPVRWRVSCQRQARRLGLAAIHALGWMRLSASRLIWNDPWSNAVASVFDRPTPVSHSWELSDWHTLWTKQTLSHPHTGSVHLTWAWMTSGSLEY